MRAAVASALRRLLDDRDYQAAVVDWIDGHEGGEAGKNNWRGKRDAAGVPVMNICAGGPPVTVAVETIRLTLETGRMPEVERALTFPKPDEVDQGASQTR